MHQQAAEVTQREHLLRPMSARSPSGATIVLVGLLAHREIALQAVFRRAHYHIHVVRDPAAIAPLLAPEQGRTGAFVVIADQLCVLVDISPPLSSARQHGVFAATILLVSVRCAADLCDIRLDAVAEWIHLPAQPGEILQVVARVATGRFTV